MTTSTVSTLTARQRWLVLLAGFLGWAFAGLGISLYILIHRQLVLAFLGPETDEQVVTRWFAWFQAAFLFGAAAGGWLFGSLGDRLGRAHALGLAILCYSLFSLAGYLATSLEQHLILRTLASLGIGGTWPGAVALVSEAWPEASRPLLAGLLGAAANVGFVLLGVLAYYIPVSAEAWRWPLLVAASPAVLGLMVLLIVPESPRWHEAMRQRRQQAVPSTTPLAEVFRPPILPLTLLGIALGAIPVVGTAANANWLVPWTDQAVQQAALAGDSSVAVKPKGDARSKALTQITRSGGAVVGSFFGGILASLLGRRVTYFLISLGAFVLSCALFGVLNPLHPWFHLLTFLLGLVGVTYFGWLPLFLPELFPTRVRATGAGVSFNTGRVVAGVVVLSAGALLGWLGGDYARIGLWSGGIYVIGMGLIWLAPSKPVLQLGE